MRLVASIGPWLPWIKGLLPYSVLLGGKAAELYYFSILEKPAPSLLVKETLFGMEKAGLSAKAFHEHLVHQGFRKQSGWPDLQGEPKPAYYREDLGLLEFRCPEKPTRKRPYTEGLVAAPDPWVGLLLEDPHTVELKYLGQKYSVRIPQTGRFILVNGLRMRTQKKPGPGELYRASGHLILILYLLVLHEELLEETLNDLLEVKPASLIRELHQNLKDHGPGTAVWEGAQNFFLGLFPETKAVRLTSWYWEFLPSLNRVLRDQKNDR